jgi:hypothetical protein
MFGMAGVEPRDIQTCVIMCRKSFGVTAAKILKRFSTAANIVAAGAIPGERMVFCAGSLFATGAMVGTLWSYFFRFQHWHGCAKCDVALVFGSILGEAARALALHSTLYTILHTLHFELHPLHLPTLRTPQFTSL